MLGFRVAEYSERGVGWKWNLLQDVLCTSDMVKLASTVLASDPNRSDICGWMKPGVRRFSVKEAYKVAYEYREECY